MTALLGYVAYFFICIFSFLQAGFMLRQKTLNLGYWPMASLVLGLGLLDISFVWVPVPLYVLVGTSLSFAGCTLNLLLLQRPLDSQA